MDEVSAIEGEKTKGGHKNSTVMEYISYNKRLFP